MSGEQFHENLQGLAESSSDIAGINVFDVDGNLINSSQSWPVPPVNIADRNYFKEFATDRKSPVLQIAAIDSRSMGGWLTVIARKVVGPNGQFLGVVSRDMSPANLEKFFRVSRARERFGHFHVASRRNDARAVSPR